MKFQMTLKKRTLFLLLLILLVLFGVGTFFAFKADVWIDRQVVTVITYPHISPGGTMGVQVHISRRLDGKGIGNALCELLVTPFGPNRQENTLSSHTDESGWAFFLYFAPDDLQYGASFKVRVTSSLGKSTLFGKWVEKNWQSGPGIHATAFIHLMTDKRWYQPGQSVHFRALCLEPYKLSPQFGQTIYFSLANETGKVIFNRSVTSGKTGVAADEFYLPPDFLPGEYTLVALCQNMKETIPIQVKFYQARRIKIVPEWSRSYLSTDAPFSGNIHVSYFFGSPVVKGKIKADITTADGRQLALSGETDAKGDFPIQLDVEDVVVKQPAEKQPIALGKFRFRIAVEENGQQEEETFILPYYGADRFCEILPEEGTLFPNQINQALFIAYFPDGSPAPGKYKLSGAINQEIQIPESGFLPILLPVSGNECKIDILWYTGEKKQESSITFGDYVQNSIAIQANRNRFDIGEDIPITLKFRDNLKDKIQTIKLQVTQKGKVKTVEIPPKQGSLILPALLPSSLFQEGNAEICVEVIPENRQSVFARRVVSIGGTQNLNLAILPEKSTCEPGETLKVRFRLQNEKRSPCPGNLSVSIVDEGILAKSGQESVEKEMAAWKERLMEDLLLPPVLVNAQKSSALGFSPSRYEARQILKLDNSSQVRSLDRHLVQNYYRVLIGLLISIGIGVMAALICRYPKLALFLIADAFLLLPVVANPDFWEVAVILIAFTCLLYPVVQKHLASCLILIVAIGIIGAIAIPGLLRARISANEGGPVIPQGNTLSATTVSSGMSSNLPSIPPLASRLRQHFPETLLFMPELSVDSKGQAELDVHFADNITSWNIAAVGNAEAGGITAATTSVQTRKSLFLEQDLPVALVCGDEPEIAWRIYNYSGQAQECTLTIEPADWFSAENLLFRFTVASEAFHRVVAKIKVLQAGQFTLKAGVSSGTLADILEWKIKVTHAGREVASSQSGRLSGMEKIALSTGIPENAFGTASYVKIYPSPISEITDSLEAMLQAPYG